MAANVSSTGLAASLGAAAVLAALLIASAAGAEGPDGALQFREDGMGVTVVGLVVLSLFAVVVSLTCGTFAAPRDATLAISADAVAKITLLVAVAFMFAFPDLSQFENKSLGLRAVFYPLLAFAPAAVYQARGRHGPFPVLLDLCVSVAVTFDIVSNDLHWYGRWTHWDDFVHVANTLPIMVLIVAALLAIERRGTMRLGFWGAALFGLAVYTSLHALWEMYEFSMDRFAGTDLQPGGMEEATRNNIAGLAGSLLGVAVLWWWERTRALDQVVVKPLYAFVFGPTVT